MLLKLYKIWFSFSLFFVLQFFQNFQTKFFTIFIFNFGIFFENFSTNFSIFFVKSFQKNFKPDISAPLLWSVHKSNWLAVIFLVNPSQPPGKTFHVNKKWTQNLIQKWPQIRSNFGFTFWFTEGGSSWDLKGLPTHEVIWEISLYPR